MLEGKKTGKTKTEKRLSNTRYGRYTAEMVEKAVTAFHARDRSPWGAGDIFFRAPFLPSITRINDDIRECVMCIYIYV